MRPLALLLALAACKTGSAPGGADGAGDITYHSSLAGDDESPPAYSKAELQKTLIAERAAEARGEREVSELEASGGDGFATARADLAVRRRFIRILELCEANGRLCPPRLDEPAWEYSADAETDPELDVPLRFDVESWRAVATELQGRACACRTQFCIDSMDVAIARLETRPMPDVQSDDAATISITRARECLFRLRGRKPLPRVITAAE